MLSVIYSTQIEILTILTYLYNMESANCYGITEAELDALTWIYFTYKILDIILKISNKNMQILIHLLY